jgi:biotin-dependent carboxylase-like uncharacterized protein
LSLLIHSSSPLHTLQDFGRFGYQDLGVTVCGPLDAHAYAWAQKALAINENRNALELIRGGFVGEFTKPTEMIITGADCGATLNKKPCPAWVSHSVEPGQIIELNSPRNGQISYLAVAGGFLASPQYGSVATSRRDGLGGLYQNGSALRPGDELMYESRPQKKAYVPQRYIPDYAKPLCLRLIPGYQFEAFEPLALKILESETFEVSTEISRMGYRLKGPALPNVPPAGLSEPIALGAVQVPPDGQPIILTRDRQSLGGYPKLGVIFRKDLGFLSQRKPGDQINWQIATLRRARTEFLTLKAFFGEFL